MVFGRSFLCVSYWRITDSRDSDGFDSADAEVRSACSRYVDTVGSEAGYFVLAFCAGVFCDFTFIRVAYYSSADTIRLERLRILFQSYWFVDIIICFGFGSRRSPPLCDYVYEGETEWRVYNDNQDILELPIAIQLNDFVLEEYPPKLAVIDRESGEAQPEGSPDYFQIDERFPEGRLGKWDLKVEKYIHQAVRNSDSTYTEVPMPGATPAALVRITDIESGKSFSHWVCGGSIAQLYMMAPLDETYGLVMTQTEPKRFMSDIVVYTEDQRVDSTQLEVNKPLRVGNWMIYQYGYDNVAGKASTYSSFELVYDPWLPAVYAGIVLFALGSICLMWSGNKKKKGGTK